MKKVLSVLCLFCLTVLLLTACGEKKATLTLTYEEGAGTVTVSDPAAEGGYLIGETVTATIEPKAGYLVDTVTHNGETLTPSEGRVSFRLEKENELSVLFKSDERAAARVTVTETAGGTLSLPAGERRVGDTVTLTATPSGRRYRLASVTNNGRALTPTDGKYTLTLGEENVLRAVFEEIPTARFTFINDDTFGNPVLSLPEDPDYLVGDTVGVTVKIRKPGYAVRSFRVNGTEVTPTGGAYRFTLAAVNEIAVTYGTAAPAEVTTDCDRAFGRITVSAPADGICHRVGESVTVTVTPDDGAVLTSVTVNGEAVTTENGRFTLTLTGDTALAATFGVGRMSDDLFRSLTGVMRYRGTYRYDVMGSDEYDKTMILDTIFAGDYIWQVESDAETGEIYYDTVYGKENRRLVLITHTSDNEILRTVSDELYENYYNPFDRLSPDDFTYLGSGVFRLSDAAKRKTAASALTGWVESMEDFLVYTEDGVATSVKFKTAIIRYSDEISYISSYDLTIEERGTATVDKDRIEPYERTPAHDALEAALRAAAEAPAYTVRHRGHEVGYEEPEGGETRPGYGDTDYLVYVRRGDMIYDSYPGEEHGFKLLQTYVYPFEFDAAGRVVLRDPVAADGIASLSANFTAFKVELFTCIGDGVYVLHNNADASAVVGFFGEGYEKSSYSYAKDCKITLKDGVLSEIVFTYAAPGIEETVTLNYTFGDLPDEAEIDFTGATKTSVLDPFLGQYRDDFGNFCQVDDAGFFLNGQEVTSLTYFDDAAYFGGMYGGKVIYIQKLSSRQIAIWSADGTLNLQLTDIAETEVAIPAAFRGTWEYHGDGADGVRYDDVFEIQTHLIRYNGKVLELLSYTPSEGVTAEAEGITYNFSLYGEDMLMVLIIKDGNAEPFTVRKTKDTAGIEIPTDYVGYYLSSDGKTCIVITYEGITVNGVAYTITEYTADGGFVGTLGSVTGYCIQFYGFGGTVDVDRLMAGTTSDNVLLERVDAVNEKYLGTWASTEREWVVRITETEIFVNGTAVDFVFDTEYGYTFEYPGQAYTLHLLYSTTQYGNDAIAFFDNNDFIFILFPYVPMPEDDYIGTFEGTADGVTYRLTVSADGTVTLTIGDAEPLVATLISIEDVYLVLDVDGREAYFLCTPTGEDYENEYSLWLETTDPDGVNIDMTRLSALAVPEKFCGVWTSEDGSVILAIEEGSITFTKDGTSVEPTNVTFDGADLCFTVGEETYYMYSPSSYGDSETETYLYAESSRSIIKIVRAEA